MLRYRSTGEVPRRSGTSPTLFGAARYAHDHSDPSRQQLCRTITRFHGHERSRKNWSRGHCSGSFRCNSNVCNGAGPRRTRGVVSGRNNYDRRNHHRSGGRFSRSVPKREEVKRETALAIQSNSDIRPYCVHRLDPCYELDAAEVSPLLDRCAVGIDCLCRFFYSASTAHCARA